MVQPLRVRASSSRNSWRSCRTRLTWRVMIATYATRTVANTAYAAATYAPASCSGNAGIWDTSWSGLGVRLARRSVELAAQPSDLHRRGLASGLEAIHRQEGHPHGEERDEKRH